MADKPTKDDVFLSVLALDSYMRGTFRGIKGLSTKIGNATLDERLGEIEPAPNNVLFDAKTVGFGATAYLWDYEGGAAKTVISYRGTDFGNDWAETAKDALGGWIVAAGATDPLLEGVCNPFRNIFQIDAFMKHSGRG